MAKQTPNGSELSPRVVSGQFVGTGVSGAAVAGLGTGSGTEPQYQGFFNITLWGTFGATIQLEKSYDGGVTWIVVSKDNSGTPAAYTAPVAIGGYEPEQVVKYRWNCTAFTSGVVNYRISS